MDLKKYLPFIDFSSSYPNEVEELGVIAHSIVHNVLQESIVADNAKNEKILNTEEPVEFTNKEGLSFYYVLNFLLENCDKKEDEEDWKNFFKMHLSHPIPQLEKVAGHAYYDLILLISNRLYNVDIAKLICGNDIVVRRAISFSLFDTLPYLNAVDDILANALLICTSDIQAEGNYFNLNESVRAKAFDSPGFGWALLKKVKGDLRTSKLFVPSLFLGLTQNSGIEKTGIIVEDLLMSDDPEQWKIGLWCIRMLSSKKEDINKYQVEVLEFLNSLTADKIAKVRGELVYTYGQFIDQFPSAVEKIEEVGNADFTDDVAFFFSLIINSNVEKYYNKGWLLGMINAMTNIHDKPASCYSHMSFALSDLVKQNPDVVFDYLSKFISAHNFSSQNVHGFKDLFTEICDTNLHLLERWITIWLNNDSMNFQRAVAEISNILSLHKQQRIELDEEILNSLSAYDAEFILYKILGCLFAKEHIESLSFSITKFEGQHYKEIGKLFAQLFIGHVLYNYASSIDYLKSIKESSSSHQQSIIEVIEEYDAKNKISRKSKPKELYHSPERMQLLFSQANKAMSLPGKKDKFKEPSFLDMIKNVKIKIGASFFNRGDTGIETYKSYQVKSNMGHFSSSFEMPVGVITDPIGMEYSRYTWRSFKRRG